MKHYMKLNPEPFKKIRSGKKTIELRLLDEKRQQINLNDEIEFLNNENKSEVLNVKVVALHKFSSFQELYKSLPLERCGYSKAEAAKASPADMEKYYSLNEQQQCGVVGIEFELLDYAKCSLTKISKFISLILRHKPEIIGITLDEHGWADVRQLIAGISPKFPIDMQTLEKVVATDEKQRYAFNEDKTKIRANQGHSIPVDVELEEMEPPEILWHGTGERYVESIKSSGILPQSRLYVHLSADEQTALRVGMRHGTPFVFEVNAGQMHRDGYRFFVSKNGVWLAEAIPPQYLS